MANNTRQRKLKDSESTSSSTISCRMQNAMEKQMSSTSDSLHGSLEKLTTANQVPVKRELEKTANKMHLNLNQEVEIRPGLCEKLKKPVCAFPRVGILCLVLIDAT